jgi:hypothetical protein
MELSNPDGDVCGTFWLEREGSHLYQPPNLLMVYTGLFPRSFAGVKCTRRG